MNRYLASALLLLWACSPNEPVEPEKPDPTPGKTTTDLTLSAAPFCGDWTKGDAVSVLDGNGNHRYTAQGDGRSVKFKGDASLDGKDIVVISPYSSTASIKDNTLLLSVPETQGRFTPLSAGCSTGTTLSMRSVTSGIKFNLIPEDITRIRIEGASGEIITGDLQLSFSPGTSAVTIESRAKGTSLTLLPENGKTCLPPGEHLVSCLPASFEKGLLLTFTREDGTTLTAATGAPARTTNGVFLDLGKIGETPPGPDPDTLPQEPARTSSFDIELVFLETPTASSLKWPFASPAASEVSNTFQQGKASFPGEKKAFVLTEEKGGYVFQFSATTGIAKNVGAHQGLKFGGAAGDYILFPAIKGLYLKRVQWVTGGLPNRKTAIVRYDGTPVAGGEAMPGSFSAQGDSYTWFLNGSEKETAYKFQLGEAGDVQIQKLILHYDTEAGSDPSDMFQEILPDEIPDFSRVGYRWGDKEIPDIPVRMTLEAPADGSDALEMIQKAVNTVETPGTILLKAGTYPVSNTIRINRSGVVLRGEGEKTVLYCTATTQIPSLILVDGEGSLNISSSSQIIARYVPVGQMWVPVRNPEMFSVGDRVWIYRPATVAWLDALHMRELAANYANNVDWTPDAYSIYWERRVTAVDGYRIRLDNPVVMCIGGEAAYGTGSLCKGEWPRISECGIEEMVLDTRFNASVRNGEDFTDEDHAWSGVTVRNTEHSWVRNITTKHFGYCSVDLGSGAKNITVSGCSSLSPVSQVTGSRRYAFYVSKSQLCLIRDCLCDDDRHQFVCGSQVPGPNVFLRCVSTHIRADAGPHQRWASGILYDNMRLEGPLNVQDRAGYGTGHGWVGVNVVCYNCETSYLCIQSPWVTGQNWSIGNIGEKRTATRTYSDNLGARPDGIWISPGVHVTPESLYESQLSERHAKGEYILLP